MNPILIGDPSIHHCGVTNCIQECFHSFLSLAHFLETQEDVPHFLLAKALVGGNEPNCKKN
jgi:hypothetical protein